MSQHGPHDAAFQERNLVEKQNPEAPFVLYVLAEAMSMDTALSALLPQLNSLPQMFV